MTGMFCGAGNEALDRLAAAALVQRDSFEPVNISNLLWGYSLLGYHHQALFTQFAALSKRQMGDFQPPQLADTARAFAKFGLKPKGLFEAISKQVVATLPEFEIQDVLRYVPQLASSVWHLLI